MSDTMKFKFNALTMALLGNLVTQAYGEQFTLQALEIRGLEKVSEPTLLNYWTLNVGDSIDEQNLGRAIKALYATRFFEDIQVFRDQQKLILSLVERPSIGSLDIQGNQLIPKTDLEKVLKDMGIAPGRLFDPLTFERVQRELEAQYHDQGYYAARIVMKAEPLERQRVALKIDVYEGQVAKMHPLRLVGNATYTDEQLQGLFVSGRVDGWKFWSQDSTYARLDLEADLDKLKNFYLNRGFAEFELTSTQIAITPDKEHIYATINLQEGEQFTFDQTFYSGYKDLLTEEQIRALQTFASGDVFSRDKLVQTVQKIRDRFAEEGYAFLEVQPVPEMDKLTRKVNVRFVINPGSRVYVRRIEIEGNTRTADRVIRREMRQPEAAIFSTRLLRQSELRINRLGFFSRASIEPRRIADDLVDLIVKVEEAPTGSFQVGIGYSQTEGASFTLGLNEKNFLGSGNGLDLSLNSSSARKTFNLALTNPYFTQEGDSLSANLYYRQTDGTQLDVVSYLTDSYGVGLTYGVPLSEESRLSFGGLFDSTRVTCGSFSTPVCAEYVDGSDAKEASKAELYASWSYDNRNQAYFPTAGTRHSFSAGVAVPGLDLEYVRLGGNHDAYFQLTDRFTLHSGFKWNVMEPLGSSEIPFYSRYYAGGTGSVRGFKGNTLGSKVPGAETIDASGSALGGLARVTGSLDVITPLNFDSEEGGSTNTRLSWFVDFGNVFDRVGDVELGEIRASTGLAFSWITPVGPLAFSYAVPLKKAEYDQVENFQFSLGVPF
jgi:outer membrane protein insertion porin family